MRERLSWLGPALVLTLFCVPLFINLGRADVENDEAIYAFAVDRIVTHGDWLNPRSSPRTDVIFVEKPPLKFWIVAAPIRLGLLPADEFGQRFWDALFGAISFVYVFAFGVRLAGPLCGVVSVLVLFVYEPLLFSHGIRGNNMEAPLLLTYCGGLYHWLAWAAGDGSRRAARWHVAAVAACFFLGFMTKFVAALFLPMVAGLATLVYPEPRRRLLSEWRRWAAAGAGVVALAAPWFIYQHLRAGARFWRMIVGEHVYRRFTAWVDPGHVRPWYFYFTEIYQELERNGLVWLAALGILLLLVRLARRRDLTAFATVAWFVVPVGLISFGSSKLHHYVYPFLPPVGLAIGFGPAWVFGTLRPRLEAAIDRALSRTSRFHPRPVVGNVLLVLAGISIAVAIATVVFGPLRWEAGGVLLFRNTSVFRPLFLAALLAIAAGRQNTTSRILILVLMVILLPVVRPYQRAIERLGNRAHPLRTLAGCLVSVREREANEGRTLGPVYAVRPDDWYLHQYFYYFRHVGGWRTNARVDDGEIATALNETPRPVFITRAAFGAFAKRNPDRLPDLVSVRELQGVLLVMPGPYAACGPKPTNLQDLK